MGKPKGPLDAAREHLSGGDEPQRRVFMLDEDQLGQLADANNAPSESKENELTAFWRAAGDRMGFNPITVETTDDTHATGQFTAWPAGTAPEEEPVDLSEGAHNNAIERMENLAREAVLNNRTLIADARDFMVEQIKARPKPWGATSAAEQQDVYKAAEYAAEELVRKIVEGLASQPGSTPIRALLVSYADKGEIAVALKVKAFTPAETQAAVLGLHGAVGKNVLITVASKDDYSEAREPQVDADEPMIDFNADDPDEE